MVDINVNEHGKVIVVVFQGEFCLESLQFTEEVWKKLLEKEPEVIAFDCSGMSFIDSSAIGLLIKFYNSALERGINLIFIGVTERLSNVLELARLDSFFTIMDMQDFKEKYLSSRNT